MVSGQFICQLAFIVNLTVRAWKVFVFSSFNSAAKPVASRLGEYCGLSPQVACRAK